jgi:hypothetical protein
MKATSQMSTCERTQQMSIGEYALCGSSAAMLILMHVNSHVLLFDGVDDDDDGCNE